MNPQPDDQQWLRRIGVTTAHTDAAHTDHGSAAPGHRDGIPADALTDENNDCDTEMDDPPTDPITTADVMVDLDDDPADPHSTVGDDAATPPARRFTPWVAAVFAAVAITATAATAGAAALSSQRPAPAAAPTPAMPARPPAPAPAPPPPSQNADTPIPFTASADCPPGSTAAQSVADPQAKAPWICARTVDGQVLHIDLGRAYVITAVSIVPGAVNTTGSDVGDPWLQHRVVTRIQWQFNDTDNTVRTQNTGNVRGEAVQPIPNVLASAITVIIQQTSRPPATAPTTTSAPAAGDPQRGGGFGLILGATPTADPQPAPLLGQPLPPDPSDGTFAVTAIKVIGHRAI